MCDEITRFCELDRETGVFLLATEQSTKNEVVTIEALAGDTN